jgi:hypothetical protein
VRYSCQSKEINKYFRRSYGCNPRNLKHRHKLFISNAHISCTTNATVYLCVTYDVSTHMTVINDAHLSINEILKRPEAARNHRTSYKGSQSCDVRAGTESDPIVSLPRRLLNRRETSVHVPLNSNAYVCLVINSKRILISLESYHRHRLGRKKQLWLQCGLAHDVSRCRGWYIRVK